MMSAIIRITEAIGRSLSDLAAEPAFTLTKRAEALARIGASCEYHVRMLATEAELTARGDFPVASNTHIAGDAR